MKRLISADWVRRLEIFLASVVLSVSLINVGETTASSVNQAMTSGRSQTIASGKRNAIAQTIETLQKSDQRWIQINLANQRLIAWEGSKPVYAIVISTGKKSTPTRTGTFKIQSKYKSTRMRGRNYDVPNVPYAMFYQGNYGIHGAYWHRKFGTPVSHGCINLAPNHAKWLFNWAELGTPVVINK